VTGIPRAEVPLQSLAGSEATLALSSRVDFEGLGPMCDSLLSLYRKRTYKEHFSWVDNVQRVTDPSVKEDLDDLLVRDLRGPRTSYLAPPEPIEWVETSGFTYTRRRTPHEPDLNLDHYLEVTSSDRISIDRLTTDRVFRYGSASGEVEDTWPLYRCIILETAYARRRYVLTSGTWFEIAARFAERIGQQVERIPADGPSLPSVIRTPSGQWEAEPDYNRRVASEQSTTALLDGTTARCEATSSGIEPCDLFTKSGEMIHVKHRKGGSSSLSHLFAQARMASEALLADATYREDVRSLLATLKPAWRNRVPKDRPDPQSFMVVLAILGVAERRPGPGLPFFSQINLARTASYLLSRGFKVSCQGIPVTEV
jgi:uncharacterized protein (TIGR04141 family)